MNIRNFLSGRLFDPPSPENTRSNSPRKPTLRRSPSSAHDLSARSSSNDDSTSDASSSPRSYTSGTWRLDAMKRSRESTSPEAAESSRRRVASENVRDDSPVREAHVASTRSRSVSPEPSSPAARELSVAEMDERYPPPSLANPLARPRLLEADVEAMLPSAVEWVQEREAYAEEHGRALVGPELDWAREAGVNDLASVRIVVGELPTPSDSTLDRSFRALGLDPQRLAALTLGHTVFINDWVTRQFETVLTHELRHVKQREDAGSVEAYLRAYVSQVSRFGYQGAGLEFDAYRHQH
ncbi:MAG TPA: hypothetical protein VFR90_11690 [Methylibium sp.]|uniref:hypothetical protein n=1 Tax=Methylibium sp. TaxID=2067992 RepID=UPI002DB6F8AD|nr:hypothetical protein [Methylibium sp.]HEU4459776.1 hypothetical protein [Methylibium sp.]